MPATLRHPVGLKGPERVWPQRPHHWLWLAAVVMAAVVAGLGSWKLVDHLTAGNAATTVSTPAPSELQPAAALITVGLQRRLRAAGYSLETNGVLDPITKSAAADFLRGEDLTASPWLLSSLGGTVLTGRHDPGAWNARFGVDRRTRMVERPLTAPGGQLDAFGNLNPTQ
jgi:hypothetical protein